MTAPLRLAASADFLGLLPECFRTIEDLARGGSPSGSDEASSAESSIALANSLAVDLGRVVDAQLKDGPAELGSQATAYVQLAVRTFVEEDSQVMDDVLAAVSEVAAARQPAAFEVSVLLLMQNLFEEFRDDATEEARKTTGQTLKRLEKLDELFPDIRTNLWLLDSPDSDGAPLTVGDLGPILGLFDPGGWPDEVRTGPDEVGTGGGGPAGAFSSFGARVVWFPRVQILDHLADCFALRVFQHQGWLDGARLSRPIVASECSRFIDGDVRQVLDQMGLDPDTQNQIVPDVKCPTMNVDADDPVGGNLAAIRNVIDSLRTHEFPIIEPKLAANRATGLEHLQSVMEERVRRLIDTQDGARVVMAKAFLDVLCMGTSDLVEGDLAEVGRAPILDQAFAPAQAFFDEVASLDPAVRLRVTELQTRLTQLQHSQRVLEQDAERIRQHQAEGEAGAGAELGAVEGEAGAVEILMREAEEELLVAVSAAKEQEWSVGLEHKREALKGPLQHSIDEEVAAAEEEVRKAAEAASGVAEQLRAKEREFRDAKVSMVLRALGLVFGLVLVGCLGLLLLPLMFGAVPVVGAPLLGFIGTVTGVLFFKVWGTVGVVCVVTYAARMIRKYVKLSREIRHLQAEEHYRKQLFEAALREKFWGAYSKKFYSWCEWARYSCMFDIKRDLTATAEELGARLEEFLDGLRGARQAASERAEAFTLEGIHTSTELVVVDDGYVAEKLDHASASMETGAAEYFESEARQLSGYFDVGVTQGIAKLRADMDGYCASEIFEPVSEAGVLDLLDVTPGFSLSDQAMGLPLFLPLMTQPTDGADIMRVAFGPNKERVHGFLEHVQPDPEVVPTDDDERILLLRVESHVDCEHVASLRDGKR